MLPKAEDYLGRRGALAARLLVLSLALLVLIGLWQEWPARPLATFPLEDRCLGLRVSQDGGTLLAVQLKYLTLWDVATGRKLGDYQYQFPAEWTQELHSIQLGMLLVEQLWFSADGRKLAFPSPSDEAANLPQEHIRLINLETRPNAPFILPDCRGNLSRIASDSPVLVTCSDRGYHLWDVATGKEIYAGELSQDGIEDVCPLSDGRVLAVREMRKTGWLWDEVGLHVWDLTGRSAPLWLPGATEPARVVAGGKRLTAARGSDLILVDLATGQLIGELRAGRAANHIRHKGDYLLAIFPVRLRGSLSDWPEWSSYVWNVAAEPPIVHGPFEGKETPWPEVSPDGRWGAFWKRENPVTVEWQCELVDLATGETVSRLQDDVRDMLFAPDSRFLAAQTLKWQPQPFLDRMLGRRAADDPIHAIKVWTVPDCQPTAAFDHKRHFAFVPGRPVLAVAGFEGDIELWELPPRRAFWIDLLLASLLGLVLWLIVYSSLQLWAPAVSAGGLDGR